MSLDERRKRIFRKRNGRKRWCALSSLIDPLPEHARHILDKLPKALNKVWPLGAKHKRQLYRDIRELSTALTSERSTLQKSYWLKPGFISAYLYYFLPWNLIRLVRLIQGLPLPFPILRDGELPLMLDYGSGPLTMPIALLLSRPDLAQVPLHIVAIDSLRRPLELGLDLFNALSGLIGPTNWQIKIVQASMVHPQRELWHQKEFKPWLITQANALNELTSNENESRNRSDELEKLISSWRPEIEAGSNILMVEPGTRLGGTWIMEAREMAIETGLYPLAPCTHNKSCPLLSPGRNGLSRSWCHFIFSAQDAPEWLKSVSRKAGLFKTSLTLSCLLLGQVPAAGINHPQGLLTRIISQPFTADEKISRYGCASCGLCLLPDSRSLISGSLCLGSIAKEKGKDPKSGAVILEPAD